MFIVFVPEPANSTLKKSVEPEIVWAAPSNFIVPVDVCVPVALPTQAFPIVCVNAPELNSEVAFKVTVPSISKA